MPTTPASARRHRPPPTGRSPNIWPAHRNSCPATKTPRTRRRPFSSAAMDARRLGVGDSIPLSFLEDCRSRVPDGLRTELPRRQLAARVPEVRRATLQGRPRAVDPHPPRPGRSSASQRETYRLADYLDQHSHHTRHTIIPPLGFWVACETLTDRVELRELGNAAEARGILRNAARLHKRAAALGDAKAAARLVRRLHYLDPGTTSAAWPLIDGVSAGDIDAVIELVLALTAAGSVERTTALLASVMANVALDDPRNLAHLLTIARQLCVKLPRSRAPSDASACCSPVTLRHMRLWTTCLTWLSLYSSCGLAAGLEQAMSLMSRAAAEARLDDARRRQRVCEGHAPAGGNGGRLPSCSSATLSRMFR